jgi:serine protease AprX
MVIKQLRKRIVIFVLLNLPAMKLILLFISVLLFQSLSIAQVSGHKLMLVNFKDKGNQKALLSNPSQFLSSRAIERRQRHSITIDQSDLPVNEKYVKKIAGLGARVVCRSRWFNYIVVETDQTIPFLISSLPFVEQVRELNNKVKTSDNFRTTYTSIVYENFSPGVNTGLKSLNSDIYNYGSASGQINMIKGEYIHNHGYSGQGMTIAVIDAGFNSVDIMPAFDSLRANNQIKGTYNFAEPGANVYDPNINIHGTEVLSTMGAYVPGVMVGTSPKADFWLLRSEVAATESLIEEYYWVSAAEFADSVGVDVINSSLGYTVFKDDPLNDHTYSDMDGNTTYVTTGADIAAAKGILVVNSAGNSGNDGDPWQYISAPADGDSVFTIGAVDVNGNRASFSSKGPTYDGRIKPTISALGLFAAIYTPSGLGFGNGTSFSSPIIAGMSACLWQAAPSLSNMQIIETLKMTASQANSPDTLLGWGIPDYSAAFNILGSAHYDIANSPPAMKLYPNPFNNYLTIEVNEKLQGNITLELYDMEGRMIRSDRLSLSDPTNKIRINSFKSLAGGCYIFRLKSETSSGSTMVTKL